MKTVYTTQGTCSKAIELDVDDATGIINSVQFVGGCPGNTIGISQLVRGMKAEDVINKLEGVRCGMKPTSCPDQLARALRQIVKS
ncbi:MAG: TIGR03905 family TSCPD domain-containing protein [Bacteroidaceae bacterium]|nr:TIGR03905 family TSCPD domain-containing protein [Bacteroidaceae bacterium]